MASFAFILLLTLQDNITIMMAHIIETTPLTNDMWVSASPEHLNAQQYAIVFRIAVANKQKAMFTSFVMFFIHVGILTIVF